MGTGCLIGWRWIKRGRLCRGLRMRRARPSAFAALCASCVGEGEGATDGDWVYSLPFGRCGVQGRPREHIVAHFCAEAYLDVLSMDGVETQPLAAGEIADIEPGTVVRFRARPLEHCCVFVAFQTEDRTPLLGHAAPFTLDGEVPDDWRERLGESATLLLTRRLPRASDGETSAAARTILRELWRRNWLAILKSPLTQEQARREGSYAVHRRASPFRPPTRLARRSSPRPHPRPRRGRVPLSGNVRRGRAAF